jgi:transposase
MEACAGAHHWGRELTKLGHEVRLIPPVYIGSSAVVLHAARRGAARGSWLEQMMARKPRMLVTVALANKTARIVWAVLAKQEIYRAPVAAA